MCWRHVDPQGPTTTAAATAAAAAAYLQPDQRQRQPWLLPVLLVQCGRADIHMHRSFHVVDFTNTPHTWSGGVGLSCTSPGSQSRRNAVTQAAP